MDEHIKHWIFSDTFCAFSKHDIRGRQEGDKVGFFKSHGLIGKPEAGWKRLAG